MVCSRPVAQVAIKRKCTKVVLKRSKKETPTQLCQLDSILAWLGLADLVSCDDNRKTLILMTSRTAGGFIKCIHYSSWSSLV